MRILGSYALVYLLEGNGRYVDRSGINQVVSQGDWIWIHPDIAHAYGPDLKKGEKWSEIFFVFNGPVFDLWKAKGILDPRESILHLEPIPYWLKRLYEVVEFYSIPGREESVKGLTMFLSILADALHVSHGTQNQEADWVAQACRWLETGSSVEETAHQLKMSYETFRKKFVRSAGMAPRHYQLKTTIQRSCGLLQEGRSNKEIAESLGFCDPFHFSHAFKKMMGCSPAEFRIHPMK